MEHEFTLRFSLDMADVAGDVNDIVERLGEAGCLDALVGIGTPGKIALDFSRSATSLEQAIRSAIADVKTAIPSAELYSTEPVQGGEKVDEILMKKLAVMESLMTELVSWVELNQLTHAQAAERLHAKTQRVDEIFKMNPRNFTIDSLVDMLLRAGRHVRFEICKAPTC
ncbi:XRE family transcriptional regulator [Herbaspirillum sp. alder98]|uniref:XRE family transcriptional regulator n=1 Tax=Herbaspirillum sp. alder98 TaxID=2913096 RepID=UPI001CD873C6|nr:XRE family transcriptional regulator [Herbaspirillum sp. alder98]MCA1325787.1 XRE family transcriptional regulator [Herbaspirillum sp. alder98]